MKKKLSIIFLMLIGFTLLTACDKKEEEKDEYKNLISLSLDELEEKVANKDTFILVITQKDCAHCAEYKPILEKVLEDYDITAYEIDEQEFTEEERGRLQAIANVSGTPNTIFITNGEEKSTTNRIVGSAQRSKIISRLKTQGYIKE